MEMCRKGGFSSSRIAKKKNYTLFQAYGTRMQHKLSLVRKTARQHLVEKQMPDRLPLHTWR
jgi:hypothetical protein